MEWDDAPRLIAPAGGHSELMDPFIAGLYPSLSALRSCVAADTRRGLPTRVASRAMSYELWCAKNDIYIQLWPLGTIEVEKSIKGVVKKLRPENGLGGT